MLPSPSKYDPFFSRSMEYPAIARPFFQQYLPEHFLPLVDLHSLTRVDRTNTDPELRKRHRDIAYRAQMGEDNHIYACAEHQSEPDVLMLMRCLYYGADSAMPYFQQYKKMPLIVTIVFYQGEKSPYPYSTQLADYYAYPEWGQQNLSASFLVVDVNTYSDAELLTHGICAPMEILLKHGRKGKFELEVGAYREVFEECIATVGDEYIFTMLMYATSLTQQSVGEKVYKFVESVLLDKSEIIMTYGQVLENRGKVIGIEQGMQKGMQQGMQKGIQQGMQKGMQTKSFEIARGMLKDHAPKEKVSLWTGLGSLEIDKIVQELQLG